MKKTILISVLLFILVMCTACNTTMAFTYDVSDGVDEGKIRVEMNTTGGWKLKSEESRFYVNNPDGETVLNGMFLNDEYAKEYELAAKEWEHQTGKSGEATYIFYNYVEEGYEENNFIFTIGDMSVLCWSTCSKDEAYEAGKRLSFELR